jgi:hypothetical protein
LKARFDKPNQPANSNCAAQFPDDIAEARLVPLFAAIELAETLSAPLRDLSPSRPPPTTDVERSYRAMEAFEHELAGRLGTS